MPKASVKGDLVRAYLAEHQHVTSKEVATEIGCSIQLVRSVAKEMGVSLVPGVMGGNHNPEGRKPYIPKGAKMRYIQATDEEYEKIRELLKSMRPQQIVMHKRNIEMTNKEYELIQEVLAKYRANPNWTAENDDTNKEKK